MTDRLKRARAALQRSDLYALYSLRRWGYLHDIGWFRSFHEGRSVDKRGAPLPWITYAAISFLEPRLTKSLRVFEYGSGSSTLWWAARVAEVVSIEHDRRWHDELAPKVPSNVTLHFIELEYGGAYARKITEVTGTFDVVVIDGRDRVRCARNCLSALSEAGVVVFDNSDRAAYDEGCSFLRAAGMKQLELSGMSPMTIFASSTSVFYRPMNCLGI